MSLEDFRRVPRDALRLLVGDQVFGSAAFQSERQTVEDGDVILLEIDGPGGLAARFGARASRDLDGGSQDSEFRRSRGMDKGA
jgi:hypothetical protein